MLDWERGVETPTQQPGSDRHSITGFQNQPEVTPLHTPLHLAGCNLCPHTHTHTHTQSNLRLGRSVWSIEK